MLTIENLNLSYGNFQALINVNLTLHSGDIYAIIGPSGCGKSSLLNILAGNVNNYSGTVLLDRQKISYRKKNIGLIAQDYGLLPWKTVHGNIILPLKIKKLNISDFKDKIGYIKERLQLTGLENRYPNQLSGGQKQRVAIAKTFIMELDLLLMDESFSALDAITREQTQELFLDVRNEKKPITLFVTHSIDEAVFLGKKIVILSGVPGSITAIIDNPTYGKSDSRKTTEFLDICTGIRDLIKKEWGTY
ncbi:MAG: ABC transporter ATP-binding protein [Defluviitaleaceae bacterium]|nr:ABC transporter ATP-binding protein [Defluviitaleaceae bacterium]